jgi:16S rRNA (cytidine1402-2'-O)-methyltransferase
MTRGYEPSAGTLYVVGTPIGNLRDLSPRACEVLGDVQVIAAEDTRRTKGLLSSIGVKTPVLAYHEHNEDERAPELVERLAAGESVALVSDAGRPLISDPGWTLVGQARARGIAVQSIPGPSAVCAALSVAGLATDRYVFEGFLPRRAGLRARRLEQLAAEDRTMVFFESVHRLAETLAAMIERFGAEREAALARELTKLHEQTHAAPLGRLAADLGEIVPLRGEFVVLVAGREQRASAEEAELERVYELLIRDLPAKRAVAVCAEILGVSRNEAYRVLRAQPSEDAPADD